MTVTSISRYSATPAVRPAPGAAAPETRDEVSVVVVECAGQQLGIPSRHVEQVRSATQVSPLPEAPRLVEGTVNLHGESVAVLDGRRRLGISHGDVRPTDRFVIVRSRGKRVVMHVDSAVGVVEVPAADLREASSLQREAFGCKGIARLRGGLFVVHDIDQLLSPHEFVRIEQALAAARLRSGHVNG